MRRVALALVLGACAQPGAPPGGPEEREPPALVSVSPDSGAVNVSPRSVVFRFDEVVSDRPMGAADLGALVVISPREGAPRVDWRRSAISVRPRRAWRANTAYTVTILPGLADLRGNVRRDPATVIFSTGPTIPEGRIGGIVFDWVNARPAARARVEAIVPPDTSWIFLAVADSGGRFEMPNLEPGRYLVHAFLDANNNLARDPREPFDSALVELRDSARVTFHAFVHDTLPPRISEVVTRDSVTLQVTFDRPVDPAQPLDTAAFRLVTGDSVVVPIASVMRIEQWQALQDSIARVREDSVRRARPGAQVPLPTPRQPAARADTAVMPRPRPITGVVLRAARPLAPQSAHRLELRGVRGLLGATEPTSRVFSTPIPVRAPNDTTPGRP